MIQCNFCGESTPIDRVHDEIKAIDCPRCGYYRISATALECSWNFTKDEKILFSGYLRNNSSRDNPITVMADNHLHNFLAIIAPYKNIGVLDKINRLIKFIGESSKFIGDSVRINALNDFPLFFCKNRNELSNLLMYLMSQGITSHPSPVAKPSKDDFDCSLTVDGWQKFEELMQINLNSKKVFIGMNFDTESEDIYNKGIALACSECGFEAYRVDKHEHNDKICDKIIADIRQSRFLIADFTGQKQGVYFEAGFAYGLGLPVIWCCRKDEVDEKKIHFDTRQYNHIVWEDIEDLKMKLINRIKATIK